MKADPKERFMAQVTHEPNSGCWLWSGTHHGKGYGHFWYMGGCRKAHRVAYELFVEAIPDDMVVMHKCDNPACVNPSHLSLGTNQDNMDDRNAKKRQAHGISHSRAKLDDEKVKQIRSYPEGFSRHILSKMFGVTYPTICNVLAGRIWRHV